MTKVKVLIEGYAKETKKGWLASSSTTLIEDSGKKIIVDPGINRKLLFKKLQKEGLTPDDIDIVFMTHYHPDHAFLASIFEKAIVVDGETIYEADKESEYENKIPGTNLEVLSSPGHAEEHTVLLAKTDKGKVVIAADVFWWKDEEKQQTDDVGVLINKKDPFTTNREALKASRRKVLEIADWIVPGHGRMFKNPKLHGHLR
jgi:glyoxylase-like metal-dependent hydrolase (beta-lactamase superfamily II)